MNIAVMGAGAVGSFYGALLAQAGHAVTLIGRPAHVAAIRRDGLRLDSPRSAGTIRLHASTDVTDLAAADLVLCCVKSADSETAAAAMAPHLRPDVLVLSLQNGVDNAARLQAGLARAVLPAIVYAAVAMPAPGHVRHNGGGDLVVGASPASDVLTALFGAAGVTVQVSDNIAGALWTKLILNCAYNALSAIAQRPYGELVAFPLVLASMRDVVDECTAVALADGVVLPDDLWERVERIARAMPAQYSSTAQDLARGKASEIDHLNGYVVRRGLAHGVATPVNRVLWTLVRLTEARAAG